MHMQNVNATSNCSQRGLSPQSNLAPCSALSFRVRSKSHQKRTFLKNMKLRKQADRLSIPKETYIPKNPYEFSDFRGLLNADFKGALVNCYD